jgi:hypothetical protein
MTWGTTQPPWPEEPGQPADEYPDFLWPDDDGNDAGDARSGQPGQPSAAGPGMPRGDAVPLPWAAPPVPAQADGARERRRRILALSVTAVIALGLGAGAAIAYRNAETGTPAVAASHAPGGGQGVTTEMELVARVTAVGSGMITFQGGPMHSVKAAVTSATRFTGSARTLAAVRVGDIVAAQILISGAAARVVTLQDPASES